MPRRFLTLLTVLAFATAAVLAVVRPGASLTDGAPITKMAAYADAVPSATPWAYIDKIENGEGWCDPDHIDDSTIEYVGDSHRLALCVGDLETPEPVTGFTAMISYDSALDECIDEQCQMEAFSAATVMDGEGCLDDNPDANAGETTWGDGLGLDWDCSYYYVSGDSLAAQLTGEPTCDMPDHESSRRIAWISCRGDSEDPDDYTLGDDEAWGALAVINMNVIAAGTDNVDIEALQVWIDDEVPIISCGYVLAGSDVNAGYVAEGVCQGATDTKKPETNKRPTKTPTPEPTATPTVEVPTVPPPPPPPTATPYGGVGPEVIAPATGSGPTTGSGAPWALWLAAGVAGAALAGGGLYLRYRRSDR